MTTTSDFTRFGKYILLDSLGKGGMGEVFLAVSQALGVDRVCAIKRILPQGGPDSLMRFRQEVEIAVKLHHSNLVQVLDVGTVGEQAYMAMEFLEGANLRKIWNQCAEVRKPFPLEIIAFIGKEVAKGLDYAHRYGDMGLVHRDISPPNIMITYEGEVKILDFGLALTSEAKRLTKPGIIYGKMPYLSPEQAAGARLSGQSDVYSLGIVLWELVTGRRLFPKNKENSMEEVKKRAAGPKVEPPCAFIGRKDDGLDDIILRMLEPDPRRRPTAREVVEMLARYLAARRPGMDSFVVAEFMHTIFGARHIKEERSRREELKQLARTWISGTEKGEPEPGDVIGGRYRIRSVLGRGGMGKVFEVEHIALGKRLALKLLEQRADMTRDEAATRFEREARAASRIRHPAVVQVMDYGFTEGGKPYIVMELLEGQDLGWELVRGPVEVARGCRIAADLARGIQTAHEAGLIHRDIKPENVYLVRDYRGQERVKLIDFGIAKSVQEDEDLTRPGITLGTPEYIAPELIVGQEPSPASDVYSFGALMFEMFTGRPPFAAESTERILKDKIGDRRPKVYELRPDLPGELSKLIEQCLSRDPDARPSNLHAVAAQLDALADKLGAAHKRSSRRRGNPAKLRTEKMPVHRRQDSSFPLIPVLMSLVGMLMAGGGIYYSYSRSAAVKPQTAAVRSDDEQPGQVVQTARQTSAPDVK